MRRWLAGLLCLCVAWVAMPAWAVTETWGDNTTDDHRPVTNDAFIVSSEPVRNYGTTPTGFLGFAVATTRSIIHFDISAIPAGSTISAATLNLYFVITSGGAVDCYQIATSDAGWPPEGTKNGTTASAGEPTWTSKEYLSTLWGGAPGVPSTKRLLDSPTVAGTGYLSFDVLLAVQDWVDGTETNGGFFVRKQTEASSYNTLSHSEHTDGQLPYLSITYTAPTTLRTVQTDSGLRTVQVPSALRTIEVEGS